MDWISVKDRLPENDDYVLIFNPKDGIHIGSFDSEDVSNYDSGWNNCYEWAPYMDPTHWMPLPSAPKD